MSGIKRSISAIGATALIIALVVFSLSAPSAIRAATGYDDEFASGTLDAKWSWAREAPSQWTLTANPGYMRLITHVGDLPSAGYGASNVLLQTPPAGDFEVSTRLSFSPTGNYQQAGLVIYQNDTTLLKLVRLHAGGQSIDFAYANGGFAESFVPFTGATTYLKILKTGHIYAGYYSSDGSVWSLVNTFDVSALTVPRVGIAAFNALTGAAGINADFDYFRLAPAGVTPTPTSTGTPTAVPSPTLTPAATSTPLPTATPTATGAALPTIPSILAVTPEATPTNAVAPAATATPTNTPTPTNTLVPTTTATPAGTSTPVPQPIPCVYSSRDDFSSAILDTKWSWVREDSTRWSLTARPGSMQITTQVGDMPYRGTGFVKNVLLQSVPIGDFEATTKVEFAPTENFHQAGLIAYHGDTSFVRLTRVFANGNQIVQLVQATEGWADFLTWSQPYTGTTTYLKLRKVGVFFTGYMSADGASWTQIGQFEVPALTSYRLGLVAFNGWPVEAPSIPAAFDYFDVCVNAAPSTPTPTATPIATPTPISPPGSGGDPFRYIDEQLSLFYTRNIAPIMARLAAVEDFVRVARPALAGLSQTLVDLQRTVSTLSSEVVRLGQRVEVIGIVKKGVIPAKSDNYWVADSRVTINSHVSVTLTSQPQDSNQLAISWIKIKPGEGFTIYLTSATKTDTIFTYVVFSGQ